MTFAEKRARITAAVACLHAGAMTMPEAAEAFGLDKSALRRRCLAMGFSPIEARATRLRTVAARYLRRQWFVPLNHAEPFKEKRRRKRKDDNMGFMAPGDHNARKREVLKKLASGQMTVGDAMRRARVSERSIRAWCRLHGVEIKAEQPDVMLNIAHSA